MSRKSDGERENLDMLLRQARESEFPLAGIPVVEGPDAQPELIWSVPVTGE